MAVATIKCSLDKGTRGCKAPNEPGVLRRVKAWDSQQWNCGSSKFGDL